MKGSSNVRPTCRNVLDPHRAERFLVSADRPEDAVNDLETQRIVEERNPAERIEAVNRFVAGRAIRFCYGRTHRALDYVQQHMGTKPRSTLLEQLIERRRGSSG
jgi:hypothetical protein